MWLYLVDKILMILTIIAFPLIFTGFVKIRGASETTTKSKMEHFMTNFNGF